MWDKTGIGPVRPNITFLPLWKMLITGVFVSSGLSFMGWGWARMLNLRYPWIGVAIGSLWFVLAVWSWWAWRPRRKNAKLHCWLSGLVYAIYLGGYFYLAGVTFFWKTFSQHSGSVIVGCLLALYISAWVLPIVAPNIAKKIAELQQSFDFKLLGCGGLGLIGLAGVIGYWLQRYVKEILGDVRGGFANLLFVGIAGIILGVGATQYHAYELWQSRPWRKEGA